MIEIRIHGRGGQGAVIASKVLAAAVFREGKWVQSFPAFGVERRGAPVTAFTRIDDEPILLRCQIYEPDHLMVLDPTLLEAVNVTTGLKAGGLILINTDRRPEDFAHLGSFRIATVDASTIAIKHKLGTVEQPIVNTAILGAYAKASGLVSLESVVEAVKEAVPIGAEENAAAAREAYERCGGKCEGGNDEAI
ncbi:MAG: pyruvate ferredoxin oxidoreductase subunit gamma [candidate division KSB1 bacterium]|nr:pyruvate ferredoxin oxidoreductase subunit gamma [candidate division KSB1 bacterium]MDZ7303527.1 pyruvate ferredoxin oxidoreductase subunit gamma [candidate division KSB1 bacterium]MDZ7312671.1 pyruvate ferredoxin oxidoreductase subunit gamma [candidate division KSB1 bacterium]